MPTKRKGTSKKMRFEVLKRDKFQCQYCGAKAPDAVLVIDHIIPVCKGGKTTILNLVTACQPCNAGKSGRELSDQAVVLASQREAESMEVAKENIEMMLKARASMTSLEEEQMSGIEALFETITDKEFTDIGKKEMRAALKKFGFDELAESMNIAASSYTDPGDIFHKTFGIAARRKLEKENPGKARIRHLINVLRSQWRKDGKWRPHHQKQLEVSFYALLEEYEADALFDYFRVARRISEVWELESSLTGNIHHED